MRLRIVDGLWEMACGTFFDPLAERVRVLCAAAGIPVGKRETQELAWSRLMDFFKKHLG